MILYNDIVDERAGEAAKLPPHERPPFLWGEDVTDLRKEKKEHPREERLDVNEGAETKIFTFRSAYRSSRERRLARKEIERAEKGIDKLVESTATTRKALRNLGGAHKGLSRWWQARLRAL